MAFINATRQNIRKIGQIQYAAKERRSLDLPKTGLLANLYLTVKGNLAVTGTTGDVTLKGDQYGKAFGLLDRVLLTANSGTEIINVTGLGLAIRNMIAENSVLDVAASFLNSGVTNNPVYQFSTNVGDNPVQFTLKVPVQINDRDPIGLILLQNGETLMTLATDFADASSILDITGDKAAVFSGNVHVTMEYYSVPLSKEDYPDLTIAHTILEDKVDIDGTGDKTYIVPRGNIYQRIIHRAIINGAPSGFNDIDRLKLVYNQSETPYEMDSHFMLALQRDRYKRDLPQGVFVHDFSYQGLAGLGGNRDLINSRAITDFNSIVQVSSGAVLGSNNNKLMTLREQLVPLA